MKKKLMISVGFAMFLPGCTSMKGLYQKDKSDLVKVNKTHTVEVFTDEKIRSLPESLKKYLRVTGFMNTPIPVNANIAWRESWIKMAPDKDWGRLETEQFNSVKPIGRVALMKFSSMPVAARDLYRGGYGEMNGKLLNLFRVVFANSRETAQSALITAFAEFMFVPGYLLSENVKWEQVDKQAVRGTLLDSGIEVSGIFYFNKEGLFTHFVTEDRFYSPGRKVKFSAVVDSYKMQGGLKINERIRVIWHLPEGEYEYFKGEVESIEFNRFDL